MRSRSIDRKPPALGNRASDRLSAIRVGRRVRLAATALVIAAVPFGTWMSVWARAAIAGVFLANHLVASLGEYFAERDRRVPHELISAVAGAAAIFVASLLNPRGEIVMLLAFVVLVAYFASSAGRTVASIVSGVAVVLSLVVSRVHDDGPDIDVLTFVVFVFVLIVTALLVDRLTTERVLAASAAERQQSEFLAAVSHELRTPLTAIQGFVEALIDQDGDLGEPQRRDLMRRVAANAHDLGGLIEQILEYTKLESAVSLQRGPVELAPLLGTIVDSLPPRVKPADIELRVAPGLAVLGDATAVRHVVINLLTNAAKFAPDGPVVIEAEVDGDDVVIAVSDTGPGVDEADRARIFERFHQGRRGDSGGRGFGLGLSIVAGYVDRMDGRVWVESEPGEGATFLISLPRAKT